MLNRSDQTLHEQREVLKAALTSLMSIELQVRRAMMLRDQSVAQRMNEEIVARAAQPPPRAEEKVSE